MFEFSRVYVTNLRHLFSNMQIFYLLFFTNMCFFCFYTEGVSFGCKHQDIFIRLFVLLFVIK